jgi:hypothetical protein
MPGLKGDEMMHEWMQVDTPQLDVDQERIILELVRDNELMLQLIRECGKEDVLRDRIISISANPSHHAEPRFGGDSVDGVVGPSE